MLTDSQKQKRASMVAYMRQVAGEENKKNNVNSIRLEDLIDKNDKKRLLFVMPQSIGDIIWVSCLFEDARKQYPDYDIYLSCQPELAEILEGNEFLHKIIPYMPQFDNLLFLEGHGSHLGFFDIAFLPHLATQRTLSYTHNAQDKVSLDLKY